MAQRKQYEQIDADKATKLYVEGTKLGEVCKMYPDVPRRTITRMAKRLKEDIPKRKPGPPPLLTKQAEDNLKEWIVAMQTAGMSITRKKVLTKANEMFHEMYGLDRREDMLKEGWLKRFLTRHPGLVIRLSKNIRQARAEATEKTLLAFSRMVNFERSTSGNWAKDAPSQTS